MLELNGLAIAALAGCTGAPGDGPTDSPTATPTATPVESASPTAGATPTPDGLDGEITVQGSEWTLDPDAFRATVDRELTLGFENVGEVAHNLAVGSVPAAERPVADQAEEGTFMAKTDTIQPGETTRVTVTPESTGTFPYWCDVPGHRDAGMVGEMTVVE